MGIEDLLTLVREGDPVAPGPTNAPTRALDQKIRYLYDLVRAAALGSTVYARQVRVEAAAAAGMPVYFNAATQQFERGLAQAEAMPTSGALVTAESSRVWGVVGEKSGDTLADVLLVGYAAIDIGAATGGAVHAGVYYLSGTTPGGLTQQRPPVSVPVLRSDGAGRIFVVPQLVDFLERHVHYRFPLACVPAGTVTPPAPGERHTIDAPDPSAAGWLPAFHPVFRDRAPAGAAFGYNLAAHPALAQAWPPVPVTQATLEWDRGIDRDVGATGVPLGPGGLCVLDRYGIWWMSDCYADVPWPASTGGAPTSESLSTSEIECPRDLAMALTLWFTRLNFASDLVAVTSLASGDPRVIVRCAGGTAGAVGDLEISLDLDLVTAGDRPGYLVLKELDGSTFMQGPVCEGVYALSGNVTLTAPATRPLSTSPGAPTLYQGPVGIAVAAAPTRELDVQEIRVDGVETQFYLDTMYLGFAPGRESTLRGRIDVPADVELASPLLALRLRVLGRAMGTLPALAVTARRLPRPAAGLATPVQLPTADDEFAVAVATDGTLSLGNQYVEATSTPFAVAAGDVVFFSVTRDADDGYPAEVGLIQSVGILSSGA